MLREEYQGKRKRENAVGKCSHHDLYLRYFRDDMVSNDIRCASVFRNIQLYRVLVRMESRTNRCGSVALPDHVSDLFMVGSTGRNFHFARDEIPRFVRVAIQTQSLDIVEERRRIMCGNGRPNNVQHFEISLHPLVRIHYTHFIGGVVPVCIRVASER